MVGSPPVGGISPDKTSHLSPPELPAVQSQKGQMSTNTGFDEVQRYVAGIDLAGAADHYVCGPRKDDGSHDIAHFGTTTSELVRMRQWLRDRKVASVAMESTGIYWIPVYDMLEAGGIKVVLVDTRQVHMIPGRKSDVKDCQWLQRLHACNLLHGAFRPPERYNAIRTIFRERQNYIDMQTQSIQSLQKGMDQMNIRLHHAVSDITGDTGMRILGAIVDGERDPRVLAKMRDRRCKKSESEIAEHLTGNWRDEHLFTLAQAYETLVFIQERIAAFDRQIRAMFAKLAKESDKPDPPDPEPDPDMSKSEKQKLKKDAVAKRDLVKLCGFDMTRIDGIDYMTAAAIVAELGTDLSAFPNEKHFVSYIGLKPPLDKSAGKNVKNRKKFKNTNRVGQILRQAASTLSKADSELGARYRCVRSRTCPVTAVKDVAREMAKRIYRGMRFGQAYVDIGEEQYLARRRERMLLSIRKNISKLAIRAEELGFIENVG